MTRQTFNAVKLTLRELIDSEEIYVIPAYQRPYCWGTKEVGLLLRDLLDFFSSSKASKWHKTFSLGTVVCDYRKNMFEILDGQQRLTTLDLILSATEDSADDRRRKQLIAAYRYLNGKGNAEHTDLPRCSTQREEISKQLCLKSPDEIKAFREFLLDRVAIRRVTIPLSGEVLYEPHLMFEIVNLRGQKLTALDVIKARFLATFNESSSFDRALFDYFWSNVEEKLLERNVKGFKIPDSILSELNDPDHSSLARSLQSILDEEDSSCNSCHTKPSVTDHKASSTSSWEPPIDPANALSIAWELFKFLAGSENRAALSEKGLIEKFDDLVRGEIGLDDGADRNVWRFLAIFRLVLQTAIYWGPYRDADIREVSFASASGPEGFNRVGELALAFMANNSYRTDAQYWLLAAAATSLLNVAPTLELLPTDGASFNDFGEPDFPTLESATYEAMFHLGCRALKEGFSEATALVIEYIASSHEDRQKNWIRMTNDAATLPSYWNYGSGLSQWQLYFIDFLMLMDERKEYRLLKAAMKVEVPMPQALRNALTCFDWPRFQVEKRSKLRTVSRGAVEHWLAQGNAVDDTDWERRNCFGNLALIDQSSNSSLGKLSAVEKAKAVAKMANPSRKLWWLAVLTAGFQNSELTSEDIYYLTSVWGRFLADCIAENSARFNLDFSSF